jgi:acyl-CoA dehydrogenase
MSSSTDEDRIAIAMGIRDVCAQFPNEYWQELEVAAEYPTEFVETLTRLGWLASLIPEEYGGGGQGISEGSIILEEIHRSGGNANACHAQMYTMGVVLRHGSTDQKARYLPAIAAGDLRLQAFGVTEPDAGSDTSMIRTRAVRAVDGGWVIDGQKTYISRVEYSDLMVLLARTTPRDKVKKKTDGLSLFLVDLREAGDSIQTRRIPVMFNHHTYQVFISGLRVKEAALIGKEGEGFSYILDGWNAERCLIASEAIGDGRYFVERGSAYASERHVFERPIGSNQGVQFPLAQAYAEVEAAALMRDRAASLFDAELPCGPQANMAKLLASQASRSAGHAAQFAFGGNAFASEYGLERKLREAALLEIAPVNNNLVLAYIGQRVLGMPRSY